ncbi:MAG: hypothetical protein HY235_17975 [Acidobacteria bacterium]|nr:hypothetical protein [Acidobacteriota bacterium]
MAFCASCGAAVEGRFCARCGASVGGGPALGGPAPAGPALGGPAPGGPAPAAPVSPAAGAAATELAENVAGALCYALGILTGILFLVLTPYNQNPRIRFHAFQSILFSLAVMVIWFAFMMLSIALPFPISMVLLMVRLGLSLFWFCLWLYVIFKTYQGDRVSLPVVGAIAQGQAGGGA